MNKRILSLIAALVVLTVSGCTNIVQYPTKLENASTRGTPVATRMSATDQGFRFLGLGAEPSMKRAMDKLYANASMSGYQISGNNYAFQNILSEKKFSFLYPVLGSSTITVCADLYAYENWTPEPNERDEEQTHPSR